MDYQKLFESACDHCAGVVNEYDAECPMAICIDCALDRISHILDKELGCQTYDASNGDIIGYCEGDKHSRKCWEVYFKAINGEEH